MSTYNVQIWFQNLKSSIDDSEKLLHHLLDVIETQKIMAQQGLDDGKVNHGRSGTMNEVRKRLIELTSFMTGLDEATIIETIQDESSE